MTPKTRAPSRLARDSAIVGAATLLSRLLGFARDVLIARLIGAGPVADAFLAALRLPNLVRRVLGEGGLNAPFVPLYLAVKAEQGEQAAQRFAGEAVTQLGLLLLALVAIGGIASPWLVLAVAGGFAGEPDTLALAALYTRLMLPFLLLTTLAAMLGALLNAEKRFTAAALAPALANAILLAALLAIHLHGALPERAAGLLAACVSLTGLAQLLLVLFALCRPPGLPRPSLRWSPEMSRLVRTGGTTLLAASIAQLVLLVATQIASGEPGSVAALYYADRVFQLPLSFVGVAMGTVVLSEMAGRERTAGPDTTLGRALTLGLALAIPGATALAALSSPIVSVLFENGRFGAEDARRTAAALALFAPGLPFAVIAKVFAQAYFVRGEPRTPLVTGIAALAAMVAIGFLLAKEMEAAKAAAGAASAAFAIQAALLAAGLHRAGIWRAHPAGLRPLLAILAASAAMLALLLALLPQMAPLLTVEAGLPTRLAALAGLCLAGLAAYGALGWGMGAFGDAPLRRSRG